MWKEEAEESVSESHNVKKTCIVIASFEDRRGQSQAMSGIVSKSL